ncbi:hypothetical protein FLM55_08160 [Francisella sp. Scap27]|uniref:hypothetical protein n=1 Tax=Francisella sp. Scap27 TaxID=2589986 RepID=UPI0015B95684|nr:hypothetical protein [Francisella sp. Scap27]QLE79708.1 hypothetical protein FLM55_08160 [Francisella sp. Scap27]
MRKILMLILIAVVISSCSLISNNSSVQSEMKIDYKNNILEINNYKDRDFNLEIISKNSKDGKYYASEDIVVKNGSHKYNLIFNQISKKAVEVLMKYSQANTMYIYTSVDQDSKIDNVSHIIFKARSNVKTQSTPLSADILFNASQVSTFYKITGVAITNNGGMSSSEISTNIKVALADKEITIGRVLTSNYKEVNCSALNKGCDS